MRKNIITLALLLSAMVALSFLFSCSHDNSDMWETRKGPKGDSIVYVRSYDNNGNVLEYYMQYALFHQLFSNGGYNSVNNYYTGHRSHFDGPSYYEYRKYQPVVRVSPVNSTTHSRISTGSSSSFFSSPARSSSSSRSFSSPSRSFSSPSRSFSSPSRSSSSSRSFSSPARSSSRSFSSPSHH